MPARLLSSALDVLLPLVDGLLLMLPLDVPLPLVDGLLLMLPLDVPLPVELPPETLDPPDVLDPDDGMLLLAPGVVLLPDVLPLPEPRLGDAAGACDDDPASRLHASKSACVGCACANAPVWNAKTPTAARSAVLVRCAMGTLPRG
jgi:hypothetical protein